jgi:hypothetical protein
MDVNGNYETAGACIFWAGDGVPLRRLVQNVIDRRFFCKKYDSKQVLKQYSASARIEADMDV